VPGHLFQPREERRVLAGKERVGEDIQAAEGDFRAAQDFCRDEEKEGKDRNQAEQGEVRDDDRRRPALIRVESLE